MVVYVFLFRHRHELNKPVVKFRYGLFFSGFRDDRYYWECIVALRKESTVILSVFGPQMGAAMLAHVALLVFMLQILVQLAGHPYDIVKLQVLDVASICICWGTMWSGFFFYTPRPPSQKQALMALTMTVFVVNVLHMLVLLLSMCSQTCKENANSPIVQALSQKTGNLRRKLPRSTGLSRIASNTHQRQGNEKVDVPNPILAGDGEIEMTPQGVASQGAASQGATTYSTECSGAAATATVAPTAAVEVAPPELATPPASKSEEHGDLWERMHDATSGDYYYCNNITQESVWEEDFLTR
jgi:hypothetical protein